MLVTCGCRVGSAHRRPFSIHPTADYKQHWRDSRKSQGCLGRQGHFLAIVVEHGDETPNRIGADEPLREAPPGTYLYECETSGAQCESAR